MSKTKPQKSALREWLDSVVFAVVAATLIRWLFLEAYTIPSSSMEKSLLIGDFLFVSKLHYGARTPGTPLQVPLTHQTIWGTNIPSFSTLVQLPMFRLPGFSEVKRNDVVVFNYPGNPDVPVERPEEGNGGYKHFPVDLRTNFIKRCIGLPGDVIEVKKAVVYVNGKEGEIPPKAQFYYRLESNDLLDDRFFQNEDIQDYSAYPTDSLQPNKFLYQIRTTPQIVEGLKKHSFIRGVTHTSQYQPNASEMGLFPVAAKFNPDFWGPIQVPKKGLTITLDSANVAKYGNVIKYFDHNQTDKVTIADGKVSIDGKAISSYTFQQDYYFMMGDNRYESADSRFWGFVPADHIVGKAVFIWMSLDPNPKSILHKVRWNRLFRIIE
ncbi:MAG: signal peptidase I [Runella sp.]